MGLLLFIICLWLADYVVFKIKHTKPNGPPVYYFFPFVGMAPFFLLPSFLFRRVWDYYLKNFPDIIVTRFLHLPIAYVKNAAVQDVQNSEHCLSRPTLPLDALAGYLMTGKPHFFVFDHNRRACDWRGIRKTNLAALNVLSKSVRFEKTAEVVDQFLQKVEEQEGRLWDYEEDLAFAKVQETSNLNLGETFEENNLRLFLRAVQTYIRKLVFFMALPMIFPVSFLIKIENFFPIIWRPTAAREVYARMTRRFVELKTGEINEARDFVEAVLRVRNPETTVEFLRETGMFNLMASTYTTQHVTMALLASCALDKRVQQKIHEELDRVVGCSPLSINHLSHLHYLKAAIHEAGRLTPPIPLMSRYTTAPAEVGGYTLQSNMRICLLLVSETMDAKFFPSPEKFIPERHINSDNEFESSKHFNIFSRGKRNCSGPDIARMSTLLYCAKLLQHFEITAERTDIGIPKYGGWIMPELPSIPLRFVRRQGSPKIRPVTLKTGLTALITEVVKESLASLESQVSL